MKKFFVLLTAVCLMLTALTGGLSASATEPEFKLSFEDGLGEHLAPENASIDRVAYSAADQAAKLSMYNIAWANRYGAVAFLLKNLQIEIGAEKNRFIVFEVAVDELASKNSFDYLQSFYTTPGSGYAKVNVDGKGMSSMKGVNAMEYQFIIVDLGWTADATLDVLRLEFKSSSLEASADPSNNNAFNCGSLYLKSVAFFNTFDDAKAYADPSSVVTPAPATPTPKPETPNVGTNDSGTTILLVAIVAFAAAGVLWVSSKKRIKE